MKNIKKIDILAVLSSFLFVLTTSCTQDSGVESVQLDITPSVVFSPTISSDGQASPTPTSLQHQTREPTVTPTVLEITSLPTRMLIPTPEILSGFIYRVNLSSVGEEANGTSQGVSITESGDIVVFVSFANNLVENDASNDCISISGKSISCIDVFVKDLGTDEIARVSISNNGLPGNNHSGIIQEWGSHTSISSDGRYIVFQSNADNLANADNLVLDAIPRLYLFDMELNQIQLIGNDDASLETVTPSYNINPIISGNGKFVVFQSNNSNLVENDTNGVDDIFLYDVQTEQIERVSTGIGGEQANRTSGLGYAATVSADGRFVAFVSEANNLVSNDSNNLPDIFLYDRVLQETKRINMNNEDENLGESNGASTHPTLSANGQFIVFQSEANNLIQNDTNEVTDIFLYHLATGQIEIISTSWSGGLANGRSGNPDISSNGRWIAFSSDANNLVPNDTNSVTDIFIYDAITGRTIRASINNEGEEGNHVSNSPAISGDGSKIAFVSLASNLVLDDTNETWDIFMRDLSMLQQTEK